MLLGIGLVFLKIFRDYISNKAYEYISIAYNNTGSNWLSKQMEGMQINSLEFYYLRFDGIYINIQKWLLIIFIVMTVFWLAFHLVLNNKAAFQKILNNNPYLKFELALALPLMLSMSMWTNLASSVPFSSLETRPFLPPEIEVLNVEETDKIDIDIEVSPSDLIIIPEGIANT